MSDTLEEVTNIFQEAGKLGRNPELIKTLIEVLDFEIKYDYTTKLAVFFTGLSAYTLEPLNLFLRGPSSIGKTYNTRSVLQVFPKEDIWSLGGLSPKALIHLHGELMDGETGEPIDFREAPRKGDYKDKNEYYDAQQLWMDKLSKSYELVDLDGKILFFLESPNFETFNMLRPILSHDAWEISYRFTGKTKGGQLRSKHVIIRGWPATIFLSAFDKYVEELATRSFTVSPMETTVKYKAANQLRNLRVEAPWVFDSHQEKYEEFRNLIGVIKSNLEDKEIVVPFSNLFEFYPSSIPRDMRDFEHLTQLIRCITGLYLLQRVEMAKSGKQYYVASRGDVELAFTLFNSLFETTRTGISQHVLDFYHSIMKQRDTWNGQEVTLAYNQRFAPKKSQKTIRRYLKVLEDVGYITTETDPEDKRRNLYKPLVNSVEKWTNMDIQRLAAFTSSDFEKGFKEWLSRYRHQTQFALYAPRKESVETDDVADFVLMENDTCLYLKNLFSSVKSEMNPLDAANGEMSVSVPNSEGISQFFSGCPLCHQPIHDTDASTFHEGKRVHVDCLRKMKEGRKHGN